MKTSLKMVHVTPQPSAFVLSTSYNKSRQMVSLVGLFFYTICRVQVNPRKTLTPTHTLCLSLLC